MIELDVTAAIGILSALGAAVAAAFGALWKSSQKAHREVVVQLTTERDVEKKENERLHARIEELQEKRIAESTAYAEKTLKLADAVQSMGQENKRLAEAYRLPRRGG